MMLETLLGAHGSFSLDAASFWPAPTTALQVPRLKVRFEGGGFRRQGQNLALTVVCVPSLHDREHGKLMSPGLYREALESLR